MTILAQLPDPTGTRTKRRRLKSLSFLPALLTLGNLVCGFAAIYFALRAVHERAAIGSLDERMLPPFLLMGAGLVILGMVFDCFDGLIARATRSTTDFGGQLDSLADVVTCGVAPATLMVTLMILTRDSAGETILPSPISTHFLGRAVWVSAAVYVAFAAVRLARFNVEHARADFDYRTFRGLPSPGAAAIITALIIAHGEMKPPYNTAIVYALPVAALCTAFLMISRIPYRRFHRAYLVGRQPFGYLVVVLLILAVFLVFKAATLLMIVIWYGLSGPAEYIIRLLRGKRGRMGLAAAPDADQRLTGSG